MLSMVGRGAQGTPALQSHLLDCTTKMMFPRHDAVQKAKQTHRDLELAHVFKGLQGFVGQLAPHASLEQGVEGHSIWLQSCPHQRIIPAKVHASIHAPVHWLLRVRVKVRPLVDG